MKKFLQKDKKDKEEKKKEKKEKKERKEKEKKSKKDKRSASSASLEVPDSPQRTSQSKTIVTSTTITSDGPGGETKTTVVKAETVKEGERVSETKTEEITGHSDENNVIQKTTTTTITQSQPDQPAETETVVKETTSKSPQGEEKVVITKTTSKGESFPSTREFLKSKFPEAAQLETTKHIQQIIHDSGASPTHVSERTVIREVNDGGKTVKTVTKVVSDDQGKRETTSTTTSGGRDEEKEDNKEEKENGDGGTEASEEIEKVKTDQPAETKTVVKETTEKTPQGEEKVIITKTSEVQSFPSTREFLMDNFPEAAQLETTKHIQQIIHDSGASPTHVSKRTVIREVNDGGKTVKTVTKVVSDDEGKRETTTTTTMTSGGKDEEEDGVKGKDENENEDEDNKDIVSENIDRKADLPEWLNNIPDTSTEKGEVKIDDSIEIPSPFVKRKQPENKTKPSGPKVVEEVNPITNSKQNLMDTLDHLEDMGQERTKEVKPQPPEEIPFDYEPKKPAKRIYTGDPVTENVYALKTVNKTEAEIDFETLEKREPKTTHIVKQAHTRKIISTNGDAVETVTKTATDEDGRVKTMETKTISGRDQKPKEKSDTNNNSKESVKSKMSPVISKRNLQNGIKKSENVPDEDQDDVEDDGREILEEIIVIEKKRKVRIPKSFVPYEKKRQKAVLPFDLLIQRERSPRKLPPVGRRVQENIEEESHDSKREMPDLNELDRLLSEMEAEKE